MKSNIPSKFFKTLTAFTFSYLAFSIFLHAEELPRIWTNTSGKVIKATLLDVTADGKVKLKFNGKETSVALDTLSEADNDYVKRWEEKKEERDEKEVAQATMFAGKQLEIGGKINNFTFEYDPELLEKKKKVSSAQDTGYRIAMSFPKGFDSRKPQKVFVIANAMNSEMQSRMGNVLAIGNFTQACTSQGWVCLAYDSSLGNDVDHNFAWYSAISKISKEWPEFQNWTFACGGNSGGAKGAMLHTGFHVGCGRKVVGLFLSSCNQATNMAYANKHYKVKKKNLRKIKCLASALSTTDKVSPQSMAEVKSDLKSEGISIFKEAWQKEKEGIHQEHLEQALKWFAEEDEDKR